MSQAPTIDDVAAEAGVSRSTVSLVLNDRDVLKPETVDSVRRVIGELGYEAAPPGRRRGGRDRKRRATNRIALLAPGIPRAAMNSAVYMDVLHGVEAGVRESGKSFQLVHLPPHEPCPTQIFTQKVDGVVVFGPVDERVARRLNGTPCVQVMGAIDGDDRWDHVTYDNGRLGQIAAEYAIARGHRHAAFISANNPDLFMERGKIFSNTLVAAGGSNVDFIDPAIEDKTGTAIRIIPERLQALFDKVAAVDPQPTCLFLAADTLAPAVCAELQRRGLRIGKNLDVISCNNEQMLLNHLHPRPATIDIHAELVGQKAVEQLLWRIDHPRQPRVTMALAPTLVEGESDFSVNIFDPIEERAVQESIMESQTEVTP
jgi:LacI family transcriptional regulator